MAIDTQTMSGDLAWEDAMQRANWDFDGEFTVDLNNNLQDDSRKEDDQYGLVDFDQWLSKDHVAENSVDEGKSIISPLLSPPLLTEFPGQNASNGSGSLGVGSADSLAALEALVYKLNTK